MTKPPWLAECVKVPFLLCRNLCGFKPARDRTLIADARNQKPFEPGEWGLRVGLSWHFCAIIHVGHARGSRPVLAYRNISRNPDQNKTKSPNEEENPKNGLGVKKKHIQNTKY